MHEAIIQRKVTWILVFSDTPKLGRVRFKFDVRISENNLLRVANNKFKGVDLEKNSLRTIVPEKRFDCFSLFQGSMSKTNFRAA